MFYLFLRANLEKHSKTWSLATQFLKAKIFNLQKKSKAFEVAEKHYNAGNSLYQFMLDRRMTYTCAYWKNAKNLDEAQEAKLDLVCKKIGLKPGMKVLDIGCGFGSFMKFAVEKYGVTAVGVSVSEEQIKLGMELCKGLPIEFRFQDYREITGKYDRIVSIGMIEAVGYKNFRKFFKVVSEALNDEGLFLLHTIGYHISTTIGDPWIDKYIFPNGLLPSLNQLSRAAERLFIVEDLHNFGADYDKTLMAWHKNFEAHWPELKHNYNQRFYLMWRYYLLQCAGIFRARKGQLWQIVLSKQGVLGGYESVR
jgi:cyclopropane-fatty-acyl-phospholipid synthase